MRMEELSDSQYIKGTDTVERYLLGLVQAYFADSNVAEPASREFIIRRAVARMKEEFRYENIGVLSITLADGQPRTGPVSITLADLGAEPVITPKLSAFNVNFGDKANTACEGNDPRLEDSRDPKPHTHNIQDINGLEGRLSTILSLLNRVSGFGHVHQNSNVLDKLVYSGSMPVIDLNFIDTLESDINQRLTNLRAEMDKVINVDIPAELAKINTELNNIENKIKAAESTTGATHKNYLKQANDYTDSKIPAVLNQFNDSFKDHITKEQMSQTVTGALSYIGYMRCDMVRLQDPSENPLSNETATYIYNPSIPQTILDEIADRGASLRDCLVDILFYEDTDNGRQYTKAPYFYIGNNGHLVGTLIAGINYDNNSILFSYKMSTPYTNLPEDDDEEFTFQRETLPDDIRNLAAEIRFYSKRKVTA